MLGLRSVGRLGRVVLVCVGVCLGGYVEFSYAMLGWGLAVKSGSVGV